MIFAALTILLEAVGTLATPVTPSKCVTFDSGILTTEQLTFPNGTFNGQFKPLAFNYRGELSYYHVTPHPTIYAEFQTCTPNYGGDNNQLMAKEGRIYLPNTKQCLGVDNSNDSKGPYYIKAMSCPNSSAGQMTTKASIPFNFVDSYTYTSWVGASTQNGSYNQGGCAGGSFGYLADDTRAPITDEAGAYRISLVCFRDNLAGTLWFHSSA